MPTLSNSIAQRQSAEQVKSQLQAEELDQMEEEGPEGMIDTDDGMEEGGDLMSRLQAQLDSLPDEGKELVADHLTPEFAAVVGLITGSQELAQALSDMADPNIALVPMSREAAKQLVAQGGAPTGQPAPQPA